jgi:hypothetical protein
MSRPYSLAIVSLACALAIACTGSRGGAPLQFTISFPKSVRAEALTGRVLVFIAKDSGVDPLAVENASGGTAPIPVFGTDVQGLAPDAETIIDDTTPGWPPPTLRALPAGDYTVRAIANVYTEFHRSDGHTIWAHMDQWEGQRFTRSPGNLVSTVQRVHLDQAKGYDIHLQLTDALPPVVAPPDTKWVKRIKIQSDLLSRFWGHPMYLGAVVLLPKDYDAHPTVRYPVLYQQGHFSLNAPLNFTTDSTPETPAMTAPFVGYNREPGYALYREWSGPHFPRIIAVTFQHPTPYYDDSYTMNSANGGPYGDALMQELIPYIESHFRIIAKPYARVLTGGSTGGWESLSLQLHHPEFFGGTWTSFPDPIDFRHYGLLNAYTDTNAFVVTEDVNVANFWGQSPVDQWIRPDRPFMRSNEGQTLLTNQAQSQHEAVLGSHGRSGDQLEAWESVYSPVGEDGYPKPLWDKQTGHVDPSVANYMRDSGYDLRAYAAQHWAQIGPQLVDKIHIDVGDMDNFFLNVPVVDFERFLDSSAAPHVVGEFHYGRPFRGHGWRHATMGAIVREMAAAITAHAPSTENSAVWKY